MVQMSPFIEDSDQGVEEENNESKLMVREGSGHLDIVDLLTQVAETYDLPSVQFIKLKIMTKDLPLHSLNNYLPGLKELDLENSNINSLRELGAEMGNLQVLRIGKCRLESLDGILSFKNLKEFSAPRNYITNIGLIGQLEHLLYVDISRNYIPKWNQLSFLKNCEKLEHLYFHGNPGSKMNNYREEVKKLLPQLIMLDGVPSDEKLAEMNNTNTAISLAAKDNVALEKPDKKFTLTPDVCGNLANALAKTKKRQQSKGEGSKAKKSSANVRNDDPQNLLLAAEQWKKTFKAFLKDRSYRPV